MARHQEGEPDQEQRGIAPQGARVGDWVAAHGRRVRACLLPDRILG